MAEHMDYPDVPDDAFRAFHEGMDFICTVPGCGWIISDEPLPEELAEHWRKEHGSAEHG